MGEDGRRGRDGEEIGMGGGWRQLPKGRERGMAASSISGTASSTPRNP